MASAMRVLSKFRSSDGRIKVATLSGVSVLVAVIALLVGVLPVFATNGSAVDDTDEGVHPESVQYGGGSGACDFVGSDARFELHINNPANATFSAPDGTQVKITRDAENPNIFSYEFVGDPVVMAAYDVIVNGGAHNLWYDNDGQIGGLQSDGNLHAPRKNNGDIHNLSHINICYDIEPINFVCGDPAMEAVKFGDLGLFTKATAQIFTVDEQTECTKPGLFFIADGETTLDFGTGDGEVAGRADFYKQFDSVDDFASLKYDGGPVDGFEDVPWCSTEGDAHGEDFGVDWHPEIPEDHTACKVFQTEYADATQHTVVYFEFEDPQFR